MPFLNIGGFDLAVLEDTAKELPSLYQGATERMADNGTISTIDATTRKRVFEVEIDLMSPLEEVDLRSVCVEGEPVNVSGDMIGETISAIITIGQMTFWQFLDAGVQTIAKSAVLHIEEA